jgi:hypothetical protein
MKLTALAAVALLGIFATASSTTAGGTAGSERRVPGARAIPACAGAGPYWPTMTLAVARTTAWVACKEEGRVLRIDLRRGVKTATVRLDGAVTAVALGFGSVWALDSTGTLSRIHLGTARITRRIALNAAAPYNIWVGGGGVWVADDQGSAVVRVSPSRNRVVARIPVGDGPSDLVFAGSRAWVVGHRDNTLFRIDTATNRATRLGTVGDDASERLALLRGSLWVTGRGTPLLEVDPETGSTRRVVELGGTGIDVVAASGSLWVPVRSASVDARGFPTMTALRRVSTDGVVVTAASSRGRVDVHGLAAVPGAVWLADNTDGYLYRFGT